MYPCRILTRGTQFINIFQKKNYSSEAEIKTSPYKVHKLPSEPSQTSKIAKEEALQMYEYMVAIRRMENLLAQLYTKKLIRGFCHLYDGQEAVCVGIKSMMSDKDDIISSYRAHGWNLVMGNSMHGVIAELIGKATGVSQGKGGSMHTYGKNFYGGNGIVGAHVPLGTGMALQHKYNNTGGISVICFGDGAANQGQVFEAYNMAKLWNLPAYYVVENNLYGMGTSSKRSSANPDYYTRGDYIPGVQADGMDFFSIREATRFCKEYILSGKGPIILEAVTYRYHGHSMSDPGTSYRSRDEIKQKRESSDPIMQFKKKVTAANVCNEEEFNNVDAKVKKELKEAADRASKEPFLDAPALVYDIYAINLEGKIRTVHYDKPLEHKVTGLAVNLK
ncbi:pyruvate dehydrogenase E1 component subunit alpha, mitochondrial-like [Onthophagus taurus]|uniref:pyruvate dehydrogenase E1 component subunit alpha, mitochondrial-like n=1 Tax=Onthophagus taurus TaxID=166361 RepID=UPI000C20E8CC|nr:pyruvate dehydrogenase E1 component subunit alpha, mitochondrial-like [Onthophagus taurus]